MKKAKKSKPQNLKKFWESTKKHFFNLVVLFIGITAAFYVENLRQNLNDKEDLKRYLYGLVDDLESDSLIFVAAKYDFAKFANGIDSLFYFIEKSPNDKPSIKRLLATNTMYIHDIGVENNVNYLALVNSGQLKLIEDIAFRKDLKDYYRGVEVWLKSYENEFNTFRGHEFFPYLNKHINFGDFLKGEDLVILDKIETDTEVFSSLEFKNYLNRTRHFLLSFKSIMEELGLANTDVLNKARRKIK